MKLVLALAFVCFLIKQGEGLKCLVGSTVDGEPLTSDLEPKLISCVESDRCMKMEYDMAGKETAIFSCSMKATCDAKTACALLGDSCEIECCEEDNCNSGGIISANWKILLAVFAVFWLAVKHA